MHPLGYSSTRPGVVGVLGVLQISQWWGQGCWVVQCKGIKQSKVCSCLPLFLFGIRFQRKFHRSYRRFVVIRCDCWPQSLPAMWNAEGASSGAGGLYECSDLQSRRGAEKSHRLRQTHLEVSWNGGTPKSSILMGFSLVNQPIRGYSHLWKPPYTIIIRQY